MKNFLILSLFFFISISAYAGQSFGLEFYSTSASIDGVSKIDDTKGIIVSPDNMNYKFLYTWTMSQYFRLNLNLGQKKYSFVDDDGIIVNDKDVLGSTYDLGVKLIFASWGALSLLQVSDLDVSYTVIDSTSINLETENINYLRIIYHQLLLNLGGMMVGLDINYDLSGSNSYLTSRTASGFKGYLKFNNNGWGINLFLSQQNIIKESKQQEFTHKDTSLGSSVYMYF